VGSTVADVLEAAGLAAEGVVRWGSALPDKHPGVYVVALTSDATAAAPTLPVAPISDERLESLLRVRPELSLDGRRPGPAELGDRLASFWLPGEVVLYVGLAGTALNKRVRQYYRSRLGAERPHRGGWWLKTLADLGQLSVHWATTPEVRHSEEAMLKAFKAGVDPGTRAQLHDPERVGPFANIRVAGGIKRHGIRKATGLIETG
jgi:hypothetical protein